MDKNKRFYWLCVLVTVVISSLFGVESALAQTVLDPQLGVVYVEAAYPPGNSYYNYLTTGAQDAYSLGFRNIEVYLQQEICGDDDTTEWCVDGSMDSLTTLASHPRYQAFFNISFDTFFLTTTGLVEGSANQWGIPGGRFSQRQLDLLY